MTHAASPVSVTSVSRFCLCNRSDSRACRTGGAGRGREATPSASSLRAKNANVNGQENLETSRRPMHVRMRHICQRRVLRRADCRASCLRLFMIHERIAVGEISIRHKRISHFHFAFATDWEALCMPRPKCRAREPRSRQICLPSVSHITSISYVCRVKNSSTVTIE